LEQIGGALLQQQQLQQPKNLKGVIFSAFFWYIWLSKSKVTVYAGENLVEFLYFYHSTKAFEVF
jgi:hypothetical protein